MLNFPAIGTGAPAHGAPAANTRGPKAEAGAPTGAGPFADLLGALAALGSPAASDETNVEADGTGQGDVAGEWLRHAADALADDLDAGDVSNAAATTTEPVPVSDEDGQPIGAWANAPSSADAGGADSTLQSDVTPAPPLAAETKAVPVDAGAASSSSAVKTDAHAARGEQPASSRSEAPVTPREHGQTVADVARRSRATDDAQTEGDEAEAVPHGAVVSTIASRRSHPAVATEEAPSDQETGPNAFLRDGRAQAEATRPRPTLPMPAVTTPADERPAAQRSFVAAVVAAATEHAAGTNPASRASADGGSDSAMSFGSNHAAPRAAAAVAAPALQFASALASAQTPDTLPTDTSMQIVQAIRLQALRDGGEAHIKLDPRQFGDVTIRVRVDQGQVSARVEAEAPVVREWLQGNQHLLRQNLAGQQLTLERLDVQAPSDANTREGREDAPANRDGREAPRRRPRQSDGNARFEVVA